MKRISIAAASFMLAAFTGLPWSPAAAQDSLPEFVQGQILVQFKNKPGAPATKTRAAALASSSRLQAVKAAVISQNKNTALLRVANDADIKSLAEQITGTMSDEVEFAEPNYIFSLPDKVSASQNKTLPANIKRKVHGTDQQVSIPLKALSSMRTVRQGRVTATYPTDPNLWTNWGWDYVGADVVWPNTTASAGVCVLDTGVDNLHQDLSGRVIMGWDFVDNDASPMDEHGHGTHVAGIIAAKQNNAMGMAGVSTGNVVAVKVLNAQGWGSNFNIAAGITYCANRTDVRVLNLSLGGPYDSLAIRNAIATAVNTKGKLVVAAAGNDGVSEKSYPAGLADEAAFFNKVLAVAASGADESDEGSWTNPYCKAPYSNHGDWISVVAPGTNIYSTLPWDKPFTMAEEYYYGTLNRYGTLSGTSMAAPFVAAAAARYWGYKTTALNNAVGSAVKLSGQPVWTSAMDDCAWPSEMEGIREVDVANLLDRGTAYVTVQNATTGLPVSAASVPVYQGTVLRGTIITGKYGYGDLLNLPVSPATTALDPFTGETVTTYANDYRAASVRAVGLTASAQNAFEHEGTTSVTPGNFGWGWLGQASLPNNNGNFNIVNMNRWEADLYAWLPAHPNALDTAQPGNFTVGAYGASDDPGNLMEGDTTGTLMGFPYAILNAGPSITISKRFAHSPLLANALLPYYRGDYYVGLTDYGNDQMQYGSQGMYIWKDGVIKAAAFNNAYLPEFTRTSPYPAFNNPVPCDQQFWIPFKIVSGTSAVSYVTRKAEACSAELPNIGLLYPNVF